MESVQQKLFEPAEKTVDIQTVLLYALGEFQSRGHVLANRELALDRLHGAFVRASAKFGIRDLADETIVEGLLKLGAVVNELPRFVAKRPYRTIVAMELANSARELFLERRRSESRL